MTLRISANRRRAFALGLSAGAFLFGGGLAPVRALAVPLSLPAHAERVASYLEGTMDSSLHSLESKDYYDVTVRHCRVTPTDARGEPVAARGAIYLYLEQAISLNKARPYRQRFMKVAANPLQGTITSTVFENDAAKSFKGLCDAPETSRRVPVTGFESGKCTVSLRPVGDKYVGGTPEGRCPSTHNGAVAVSSKVSLGKDFMNSWDQGWGADGTQVWGAVDGGYRFRKVASGVVQDPEAVALAGTLTGFATNEAQVQAAPADFALVSNDICLVSLSTLPSTRTLYVEQNVKAGERSLLRQRIYEVDRNAEGVLRLFSHAIDANAGQGLKGLCRQPREVRMPVAGLAIPFTRDDACFLTFRLDADKNGFVGRTPEGGCASTYAGATTLEIDELLKDGAYEVWERWYDAAGLQVAGSKVGPYVYVRK
ncbi:MAG: chromophore lyase CpcT/CpeT [Silvanigrellales bacterium]|jgi:hypothetical protein|nr:chromophore lyase CpcT/CpeT [Silvanigrellales bacterium]